MTDSFHGCAFSIIYQRPLYAVKRIVNENDIYDHDCRIKNIFETLGIRNFYLPDEQIDFLNDRINYSDISKKLLLERKKSMKYLKSALKGKESDKDGKRN